MDTETDWKEAILKAKNSGFSIKETREFALRLAESGTVLNDWDEATADVASTGGPSSLTTLLAPLFLVTQDYIVPKLGVPGRPAGGLDVLAQIPGYRVDFSVDEVFSLVQSKRYLHFQSAGQFAPADAFTFNLRKALNAQAVPVLAIASLLSKKIAVGVEHVGLDVRVAPFGNFGTDFDDARENASLFVEIADSLGINACCVLTDARQPYQPYIGRLEALWALWEVFSGTAGDWLLEHVGLSQKLVEALIGRELDTNILELQSAFLSNCETQGGKILALGEIAEKTRGLHRDTIRSDRSGYCNYDLSEIRRLIVEAQARSSDPQGYPDSAGLRLLARPNKFINKGDEILSWRFKGTDSQEFGRALRNCFKISEVPYSRTEEEIIHGR